MEAFERKCKDEDDEQAIEDARTIFNEQIGDICEGLEEELALPIQVTQEIENLKKGFNTYNSPNSHQYFQDLEYHVNNIIKNDSYLSVQNENTHTRFKMLAKFVTIEETDNNIFYELLSLMSLDSAFLEDYIVS